jgi:hypothetical protein
MAEFDLSNLGNPMAQANAGNNFNFGAAPGIPAFNMPTGYAGAGQFSGGLPGLQQPANGFGNLGANEIFGSDINNIGEGSLDGAGGFSIADFGQLANGIANLGSFYNMNQQLDLQGDIFAHQKGLDTANFENNRATAQLRLDNQRNLSNIERPGQGFNQQTNLATFGNPNVAPVNNPAAGQNTANPPQPQPRTGG